MSLFKRFRKMIAGLVSASMLMTPIAGAGSVLADDEVYSISISIPDTVIAGEPASFTATVMKNGEVYDFDTNEDGLHVYWWCDSLSSDGGGNDSLSSVFTFPEAGTYSDFKVELKDGDYAWITGDYPTITVLDALSETEPSVSSVETEYSVSVSPETVTAGVETTFTATFYKNGEAFNPSDDGLVISWWSESIGSGGSNSTGLTNTFTYETEGTYDYDLKVELWDPSDWSTALAGAYVTVTVTDETTEPSETIETSETSEEAETSVPETEASETIESQIQETEPYYEAVLEASPASPHADDEVTFEVSLYYVEDGEATQITDLTDTGITVWFWNNTSGSALDDSTGNTLTNTYTFTSAGDYEIQARVQDSSWKDLITPFPVTTVTVMPGEAVPVEGDVNFDGVPTLPETFYLGVDVSSVVSELNAGVVYYDYNGNALTDVNSFIGFIAAQGVNCVRVRVWNNPYDSQGNGFGGGNNDVATAAVIANACEQAGITMLVDFHLSDFWCDPGKQQVPAAWSSMSATERASAVAGFITDSLNAIDPNHNTVAMVQVGNETNGAVCGVSNRSDMCRIFDAGCDAVHSWDSNVRAVIHFTNPENGTLSSWADTLSSEDVSADILATSYYPYWHGSLSNLTSQLSAAAAYGFDVMVAETSYAYTLADSDGHSNTVRPGNNDTGDNLLQTFSVQGQARAVRDVINAVNRAGGIGTFYWEPAWITVGNTLGLAGDAYDSQVAANRLVWEACGCGWASSYASVYDPNDAGRWYGGSAVDNEALFYPDGRPTDAWGVFENIRTGETSSSAKADSVETFTVTIDAGSSYTFPAEAIVTGRDGSTYSAPVTWNAYELEAVDTSKAGTYVVSGFCEGLLTSITLNVRPSNLINDDIAGFETTDFEAAYTVEGAGITVHDTHDARTGSYSAHWWSAEGADGSITLTAPFELTQEGTYTFTGFAQGDGDKGSFVTFSIVDASTGEALAASGSVQTAGWNNWLMPEASLTIDEPVTVQLVIGISYAAEGWGSIDDLLFYMSEAAVDPDPDPVDPDPVDPDPVDPDPVDPDPVDPDPVDPSPAEPTEPVSTPASDPTPAPSNSDSSSGSSSGQPSSVIDAHSMSSFIDMLYRRLLGREPDEAGKQYWLSSVRSGDMTVEDMIEGFIQSEEYQALNKTDAEYIEDLYFVCLRRGSDANGLANWLRVLATADDRTSVVAGFLNSEEYGKLPDRPDDQ